MGYLMPRHGDGQAYEQLLRTHGCASMRAGFRAPQPKMRDKTRFLRSVAIGTLRSSRASGHGS
jgi:hypothetical protein